MPRPKPVKYGGRLDDKFKPLPPNAPAAKAKRLRGQRMDEAIEKLADLIDVFGLDVRNENIWYRLALTLACTHVGGFQTRSRGSKRKWTKRRLRQLVLDVDKLRACRLDGTQRLRKAGAAEACRRLAKMELYKGISDNSLRVYYENARAVFLEPSEIYFPTTAKEAQRKVAKAMSARLSRSDQEALEKIEVILAPKPGL